MKYLFVVALVFCLVSCQQSFFGVDEATWTTLSEKEREKVIEGYNDRKELQLIAKNKEEEYERQKDLRRQEIEAENAPLYAVADVVSTIVKGSNNEGCGLRIQSIQDKPFKPKLLIVSDQVYEISTFSKPACTNIKNSENFILVWAHGSETTLGYQVYFGKSAKKTDNFLSDLY